MMMQKALDDIVQDDAAFKALCDQLDGEEIIADLRDMAMCLEVADWIGDIQERFERPLLGFDKGDAKAFYEIYQNNY